MTQIYKYLVRVHYFIFTATYLIKEKKAYKTNSILYECEK